MANYEARERTNYFKVKDPDKFREWATRLKLEINQSEEQLFALIPNSDYDEFPGNVEDEEGNYYDVDFDAELATHLADGEVVIIMHVGYEKFHYLCGYASAFDNKGQSISISLNDIYEQVKEKWGIEPTECSY